MPLSPDLARAVDERVESIAPALDRLAIDIHENPELKFQEFKAAAFIAALVREQGHVVEVGVGGLATAVRARAGKTGGPRVAILAEYDALPEIGHACGHNLIAASAVGAFLAAAPLAERAGGEVVLLGTPAEEGGGGKIDLIDAGAFAGLDAAMMIHPFDRDLLAHGTLANLWINFVFGGVPVHAAMAPHEGKSALTACMDTFRLIDGQRVHFQDGVRVHGYIIDGGRAVNIIPERAECELSVRARDLAELERVKGIVERCARAAAMASDVTVEVKVRRGYADMRNNLALARAFGAHARSLGRTPRETDPRLGMGSTDMGDVSHVLPAIHPWIGIVDEGSTTCHTHTFADAAKSERGLHGAHLAAKVLARTALEVLEDPELRARARAEFQAAR